MDRLSYVARLNYERQVKVVADESVAWLLDCLDLDIFQSGSSHR